MAQKRLQEVAALGGGMIRDTPRHQPADGFWDARDVLVDQPGIVRKRGGTRPLMAIPETMWPEAVAIYRSGDIDGARGVYVFGGGKNYASPFVGYAALGGGGFKTFALGALAQVGKPFRYGPTIVAPQFIPGADVQPLVAVAGSDLHRANNFETLTAASMATTAGSHAVTLAAADAPKAHPGRFIFIDDGTNNHFARIVRRSAAGTTIYLDSAVPWTDAALNNASVADVNTAAASVIAGAKVGCAFQNRVILGGVHMKVASTTIPTFHPDGIIWSVLPTEVVAGVASGLTQVTGYGYDADNLTRFPQLGEIVALSAAGPSELLVFGPQRIERIAGNLVTIEPGTDPFSEASIDPISATVGCLGERTVQETPYGVVWAAQDGVWLYAGGQPRNLMDRTIQTFWAELQTRDGFQAYGSALVRGDHYVISTSDATLLLRIPAGPSGWTRLRDDLTITGSMADPRNPSVVYATSYTDPLLATEPDPSRDQVFRLDTIIDPKPDNGLDHDGHPVECFLETRTYPMGDPARLKALKRVTATADLKNAADEVDGNIAGINADAQAILDLPNLDAEFGSTLWWSATGSSLSTITADSSIKRSGRYSIKCVTAAADGGVSYDLPGGYADSTTIISVEAWVRVTTAGTLTMDVGGTTATTTTTGSFVRLAVAELPSPTGEIDGYKIAFSHSQTAATFYVDDVTVSVLLPWQTVSSGNNLVTGATATIYTSDAPEGYERCIRVATASGTANTGLSHRTLGVMVRENQSFTATAWVKADSSTQDYVIFCGSTGTNGNTTITATTEWKQVSVDFTASTTVDDGIFFTIRKADAGTAVFYIAGLRITTADAEVGLAVIGGLEGEGDDGDGVAVDTSFASLESDYDWLLNGSTVTVSSGDLAPSDLTAKAFSWRRGGALSRDGEAIVSYTPGHADDRIAILLSVIDANNYLYLDPFGGGVSSIQKVTGGSFTSLASGSPASVTIGVRYWVRAVRKGRVLTLEHWTTDPRLGGEVEELLEPHYLSDADAAVFAEAGKGGFRFAPGSTAMRVHGFWFEPYDNLARIDSDPSAPVGAMGTLHLVTRGASLVYRQYGAAAECEFGPADLEFDLLRPGRT